MKYICSTITTTEKTNTFTDEKWTGHWIQVNNVHDWLVGLWTWLLWCFRVKWKGFQASLKHSNRGSALAGRGGSGPALWREGAPSLPHPPRGPPHPEGRSNPGSPWASSPGLASEAESRVQVWAPTLPWGQSLSKVQTAKLRLPAKVRSSGQDSGGAGGEWERRMGADGDGDMARRWKNQTQTETQRSCAQAPHRRPPARREGSSRIRC